MNSIETLNDSNYIPNLANDKVGARARYIYLISPTYQLSLGKPWFEEPKYPWRPNETNISPKLSFFFTY